MSVQQGLTPTARLQAITLIAGLLLVCVGLYAKGRVSPTLCRDFISAACALSIAALIQFGWIKRTMALGGRFGPNYTVYGWPAVLLSLVWMTLFVGFGWSSLQNTSSSPTTTTNSQTSSNDGLDTYRVHATPVDTSSWQTVTPFAGFSFKVPGDWVVHTGALTAQYCYTKSCINPGQQQVSNIISPNYAADHASSTSEPLTENTNATAGANIGIVALLVPASQQSPNSQCLAEADSTSVYSVIHVIHESSGNVCEHQDLQATIDSPHATFIEYYTATSRAAYTMDVYLPANADTATKDYYYSIARAIAASFVLY